MRLKGLDLNLLVALDVLLDECSVSRAAERLHVSQPAASAALGRLRDYFSDELLVLHGKRMIPTSCAERLRPEVRRILAQVVDCFQRAVTQSRHVTVFSELVRNRIERRAVGDTINGLAEHAPRLERRRQ